ncbi:TrbG/VirB9 family P-type conjugative transfer protein [Acidithiobacillus montserratensis]|uniref:TrbG/VirB9 family P-type conjugative transfer protein n=1 Tax=Acidithiobacillus montserratensis TaxID=2729135 RepID=A0ACD5HJ27_9PROT
MQHRQLWMAAVLAATPGMALAGVVTGSGLPPVAGFPNPPAAKASTAPVTATTASTVSTKSAYVVPAIHLSPAQSAHLAAQKVWNQTIETPPEGKESPATALLAKQSIATSSKVDVTPPVIGAADGAIVSLSGRPALVCSPLHTCVIALPAGTKPVTTVGISPAEWNVQQAMVGKQPEIFLSPKFAGLHQNLVVAAASKDGKAVNYQVRLVSDKNAYVPILRIASTHGTLRSWSSKALAKLHTNTGKSKSSLTTPETVPVLPLPLVPVDAIHTNWTDHCGGGGWFGASDCGAIRPLRVYDDGTHTFIQMPVGLASHGGFPMVQAYNRTGKEIGIDTQIRGHLIVIDSVPHKIRLRLGHEVVNIQRGVS